MVGELLPLVLGKDRDESGVQRFERPPQNGIGTTESGSCEWRAWISTESWDSHLPARDQHCPHQKPLKLLGTVSQFSSGEPVPS